jgi:hypothetical protein
VASNLVHDTKTGGYHQHYGETNTVRNNIFAHGVTAQLQRSRIETNHVSFVFENNIVYWPSGTLLYSQWADTTNFVMRSNLYWQGSSTNLSFAGNTFAQWQALGQDLGSRIVDPLFVDGMNRDFRLAATSTVAAVGFRPFDLAAAGVYGEAAWRAKSRVPSQPDSLPQPVSFAPFDFNEDFEALRIGAPPPHATVSGTVGGASLSVVSNVPAFGTRCLAVTDAPGLAQTFFPFFNYTLSDLSGSLNYTFNIRLAPDTKMYYEWRDYPGGSYVAGPSLWFEQCKLKVGGVTLASVPSNQWLRVEVSCSTTNYASQGWKLGLTLPGQATQWFANLHTGGTGWARLNWMGWVSEATNTTTFYLDNFSMTNPPAYLQDPVPPAPVISGLVARAIAEDTSTGPIPFTVADVGTPANLLALSVCSSNTRLLPESNILLGGSGMNRTLTLAPAPDETGVSTLFVTADNGQFHATEAFQLTVTPVGGDALRGVEITSPRNDFTNAASVLVAAAADDPDGALTVIDFFVDGQALGQSDRGPFALSWTNLAHGSHTLVAVARDTGGHSVTSAPVTFTHFLPPLPATLIPGGMTWRYVHSTNDLGTAWRSASFNDTSWKRGPAMLGFGAANGLIPVTTVANNRQWTTYFRSAFVVPSPASISSLSARLLRDDGAAVYLNGAEVWRDNLPAGVISNGTPAATSIGGAAESIWLTNAISPSLLVSGTNLVAVEIHQQSLSSTDITFDFELRATAVLPEEPKLNVAVSRSELSLNWPATDPGVFGLYGATNLNPPVSWIRLTNAPILHVGTWQITPPLLTNGCGFFQLQTHE